MFILFKGMLFNSSIVLKITRVVSTEEDAEKPFGICLTTPAEEVLEHFKTKDTMNRKFDELCEQVGANACGGY